MGLYELAVQNALLYVLIQGIIIVASSTLAYFYIRQLYNISQHRGIKYFSNSFLFFALGFFLSTILGIITVLKIPTGQVIFQFLAAGFYYCLTIAAFYLLFSLVWKRIEDKIASDSQTIQKSRTMFQLIVAGLHALAVIIGVTSILAGSASILFVPVLLILLAAIKISYSNYKSAEKKKTAQIRQLFFISMLFGFIGFLVNFVGVEFLIDSFPKFMIYQDAITVLVFLLLLFGILRGTNKW